MLKGIQNQFERLLRNIGNLSIKKKKNDYNGLEHIQNMKRVHNMIKNKQQNKKPCHLWRLLRYQLIQKIDKAKTKQQAFTPSSL